MAATSKALDKALDHTAGLLYLPGKVVAGAVVGTLLSGVALLRLARRLSR